MTTDTRLEALELQTSEIHSMMRELLDKGGNARPSREWYTTDELAEKVGCTGYTVREWCRLGRINASKRQEQRGRTALWQIAADEYARYKNEGLLLEDRLRNQPD